ncbi:hypothetical protein K7X08_036291 [Anisodus acutangulus]|uniref:Uncharacterized protein n=1 Tax=Anisodus acutangulus TaxID=402998 RepID=A0A9Q1L6G5_9SOLA|nr:hypothetical protein K7X08_036291 [Anisodus acutangulus]
MKSYVINELTAMGLLFQLYLKKICASSCQGSMSAVDERLLKTNDFSHFCNQLYLFLNLQSHICRVPNELFHISGRKLLELLVSASRFGGVNNKRTKAG